MKIVIAGDVHFPNHSDKAIQLFYEFLKDYKPDVIVFNGDILDCESISKFEKIPGKGNLTNEISLAWQFFSDVRTICPESKIHFITGNHEWRHRANLIMNIKDPATFEIIKEKISLKDWLGLDKLKIEFHDLPENITRFDDNYIYLNGFYIGHFNKVNAKSGYTSSALMEKTNSSIIQGHTHRLSIVYKKTLSGTLIGAETGCLCKTEPDYCVNPNWQNGWIVIENKNVYPIHIQDDEFTFNGKMYSLDRPIMLEN